MTDEEKKAIKIIQREINELQMEIDARKEDRNFNDEPELAFYLQQKETKETVLNLIQKQEKVIDGMADKLSEYTCWNKDNLDMNKLAPIEEIKQYFYKKAEEGD